MTIQNQSQEKFKTLIGGQALIEGILMQGPDKRAVVVRGPEGLVSKVEPIKKRTGILTWPLIRGVVNFGSSMVNGVVGDLQRSYLAVRPDMKGNVSLCDNVVYYGIPESAKKVIVGEAKAKASIKNILSNRKDRTSE